MYITRLESKEIFSPSNKIHREVNRAKGLSALRYVRIARLFAFHYPILRDSDMSRSRKNMEIKP